MSFASNTPIQYIPGIGWRTTKILQKMGIYTAGELNAVPESLLVELFGPSIKSVLNTLYMQPVVQRVSTSSAVMPKRGIFQKVKMAARVMTTA